ncbi:MAG: Asp-tRNA(Asn)/Glu-tRNA(Gln) amidotransferase subunit GatA [Acidobacteria bacterium]|nr:Asp-tRNA(Asn)/Glu-tRNA(Gln) amidotransferase subunit GatA [Acidobacteriota bacterium]MCI0722843.1 Asp-tRNA(Asn)/Glu-tRNA(Gln) amidotransferase subunit GatA [Acidobacteriota bacterium]
MEVRELTIDQVRSLLERGEVSAVEICQAHLESIDQRNSEIKAFIHSDASRALEQAARIDQTKRQGEPLPVLAGVPLAIKDNISIEGQRCTCGSKILENYTAMYDATAISKLRAAGAVFVGKANMDEFAMGSSTENSAFFQTRNPHATGYVPGGSSGGSAAAVAGQMAVAALGSDTGGSIRQPASFCGVVGLKPTYGRVSRYGLVAFGSSLDQIGPLTRTVKDAARVLGVIAGSDMHDATSVAAAVPDYVAGINASVKGIRIGLPKQYFKAGIATEVNQKVQAGLKLLERLGCELVEVELPHTEYAIACYYVVAMAEASSNLARFDGVRYGLRVHGEGTLTGMYRETRDAGFGNEVKRRIILGTFVLSSGYYDAYYLKAQKVRTLIKQDFEKALAKVDVIASPTSPTPPFRLGEKSSDPLAMYLSDIFTITANLAGIPGISVPCGKTAEGLPVGLQLLGKHFDEATLLRVGHAFETEGGFTL